jgi:predicted Zn-dependent peptidase
VVVDQIRRYDNSPDGKFNRVLRSMTYDAHPYGWAHWFSDLSEATREDHWEIFYKYFIPQNLVLVVVGEIEAERVFALAEDYFGSWQAARPSPRLRTVEPEAIGQKRLSVTDAAGPAVAINVPMPAVGHPDAPAFDLLAELLGGPRGRLSTALVDEARLATRASASAWTSRYPSHFAMQINARDNSQLDAVEDGINEILDAIAAGRVDEAELRAAAQRLTLSLTRSLEEIGRSAVTIGAMETIYSWEHLNALPDLWADVSVADLQSVVDRYFAAEQQVVGHLRRKAADEKTASTGVGSEEPAGLNTIRPGQWPVGGPVDEFFLNHEDIVVARQDTAARDDAGSDRLLGLHDAQASGQRVERGATGAAPDPQRNEAPAIAEPIAIAEQPWYVPPFMAERRAARFADNAPTRDYRELRYPEAPFPFPDAATYRLTLDNGLSAFVVPEPLLPQVRVTALIDLPSIADPSGKEGLGHLLASLLRKGGDETGAFEDRLEALGASLTIEHDRRGTRLDAVAPAEAADELLALIARMVAAPDLATAFEDERERLALAAERARDDALFATRSLFDASLYGEEHPLGARESAESLRALSLDDLRAHHATSVAADRVAFVISGAVTRAGMARVLKAQTALQELPATGDTGRLDFATPTEPETLQLKTLTLPTRQAQVMLGHLGIEGRPEDHAALEIMHHILAGGGFASRMMGLLRAERGITSALYGEVEPGRGAPNPYLWRFGGRPETLGEGIGLAMEQIRQLRDEGVTQEEFEAARTTFIDGLIPASYDTAHKIGLRLAHKAVFGQYAYQSPHYLNYYAGDADQVSALRELTLEDVNAAARKYLKPDQLVIVVSGQVDVVQKNSPSAVRERLGWTSP